jgi:hypothetical protein
MNFCSQFVGVLFVVIFPKKLVSCQSEFGSFFCLKGKEKIFRVLRILALSLGARPAVAPASPARTGSWSGANRAGTVSPGLAPVVARRTI